MCCQHERKEKKRKRTANDDQITALWNNTARRTGSAKLSGSRASHVGVGQRNEGLSEKRLQLGKFCKQRAWLLGKCARGQRDICMNCVRLRITRNRGIDLGLILCRTVCPWLWRRISCWSCQRQTRTSRIPDIQYLLMTGKLKCPCHLKSLKNLSSY